MRGQLLLNLELQVCNGDADRQVREDNAVPELVGWAKDLEFDASSRIDWRRLLGLLLLRLLVRGGHTGSCDAAVDGM